MNVMNYDCVQDVTMRGYSWYGRKGKTLKLSNPRIHDTRELVDLCKKILKAGKIREIG